jgi:hypothetical protein
MTLPFSSTAFVIPSKIVSITNFDGDTIQFVPDERFDVASIVKTTLVENAATRDLSQHVNVNTNSNVPINYSVPMISDIFNPVAVGRVIDDQFTEF